MKIVNATPHPIALNNGTVFEPSGVLPRVKAAFEAVGTLTNCECDICVNGAGIGCQSQPPEVFEQTFGTIEGLPDGPDGETVYIVSAIVLAAAKAAGRVDVLAPATGHPDCVRNDKGHIVSVPGFVQ